MFRLRNLQAVIEKIRIYRFQGNNGFTLIELLVVMAIMILILAITPLLLPDVIASTHVKSTARELATDLRYARNRAIDRKQEIIFSLNVNEKTYRVDDQQKFLTLPEDTRITLIAANTEQLSRDEGRIIFFTDGSSTGGQIKLVRGSQEFLIDVNWLTGRIKILTE